MAESLFLNKTRIDLYSGRITRNIRIGDIGDISARKSSYSYTISVPKTSGNVAFFDMLSIPGNTSRKPFEEVVADYVVDEIPIIINGYGIIRESGKDFKLNIIDGVRSLSELLNGKKIIDLPLEDLSHVLTSQVSVDSYANKEGYIYGVADYGKGFDTETDLKVEEQAPSIYVHTLFRRIFESVGLSLQGEFFTTNEKYLSEVLAPSRGNVLVNEALTSTSKGNFGSISVSKYLESNDYISSSEKINFTDVSLIGASVVDGEIVFSVAGTYEIEINSSHSLTRCYGSIEIKKNDETIGFISLGEESLKTVSLALVLDVGDIITIYMNASSESEPLIPGDEGYIEGSSYFINYEVSIDGGLTLHVGGNLVKASDYIGDISQLDFIKDVVNRYGLLLHPIQSTNEYKFKRIDALLSEVKKAEDWTEKVVSFGSENYKSGYAKSNKASFKYPAATVVPTNDGEMIIDNVNLKDEKTFFTSTFEIPVESSEFLGGKTYLIPIRSASSDILETPLKIFNVDRMNVSIEAKLFGEASGATGTNLPFLSIEFISMQYFINNHYRAFKSLIENYRKIPITINLSLIDIFNLDFFKLKYLKQTGRFYYALSVQNKVGEASKVEAIEISDFPENQPPTQIGNYNFDIMFSGTKTITSNMLIKGYEDPELDLPYKLKIVSGFNSDVLLKQGGVTISSETEILIDDLDLTAVETTGGAVEYIKRWLFGISDVGSKLYKEGLVEAEEITEGRYVNSSGGFTSDANMSTDKYSLTTSLNYLLTASYTSAAYTGFYVVNYFDSSDVYISSEALVTAGVIDANFDNILTPPLGASYVLINRQIAGTAELDNSFGMLKANVYDFTNFAPVADAGVLEIKEMPSPEIIYPVTTYFTLNGSGSYDWNDEIVSYSWEIIAKPSGSTVPGDLLSGEIASLGIVNDLVNDGIYTIRLTVTDSFGLTDGDIVQIRAIVN